MRIRSQGRLSQSIYESAGKTATPSGRGAGDSVRSGPQLIPDRSGEPHAHGQRAFVDNEHRLVQITRNGAGAPTAPLGCMTVTTATDQMDAGREAAALLAAKTGADRHDVALVLGSGWVLAVDAMAGEYEQFPEEVLEAGRQAATRASGLLGELISRL